MADTRITPQNIRKFEIKEMSEQIVTENRFAKFIMLIGRTIVLASRLKPMPSKTYPDNFQEGLPGLIVPG